MNYAELHCLSNFTFLRGASHAEELVERAHELGYTALAITDECSLAGVVRAHMAAQKCGLKLIIGSEMRFTDGPSIVLLATDRTGYGNLSALITRGRRNAGKGSYSLALEDIRNGVTGCLALLLPDPLPSIAQARLVAASFPEASWLAVELFRSADDAEQLEKLRGLGAASGLPLVAAGDVHMHVAQRRAMQDTLTAIRLCVPVFEAGAALYPNGERHLRELTDLAQIYPPELLAQTLAVAERCQFSLDELRYEYPEELVPKDQTAISWLRQLTEEGLALRFPDEVPDKARSLVEYELALIEELRYEPYFLTVHDIVRFARSRGILCQGRGSAANSAVCYALHITEVNPACMEMLFERFISKERNEPPDIDVDFEHERREEVIQHIYARYGRHRAGLCATVIHYRPRSAIREVGKAMGLSEDVTGALAKTVWGSWGTSMGEANSREAGVDLSDPLMARTIRLAEQMIGLPRHLGQHVGGFVLTEGPLHDTVPIGNAAMPDRSFIEWDKDDIDELGILKVDVLALGMLTCIRKCFDILDRQYGVRHDLASIPQDDAETYDMLCRGDSIGVFQVESRAQMNMLPRLKPRRFYDLVIEVAIVRPGPIQGDMVHPYLRRRSGDEPVIYPSPGPEHPQDELKTILSRTLGVPIFQEQAMKIAMEAARFSSAEANALRRAMATFRSHGTIGALEELMVGRMIGRGYDPEFARRCFNQIKGFGDYGFPESHAASFALLVYVSSWLKCHYPAAFACALLNSQPMGFYAPAQIVRDAREHGVPLREADVNFSEWDNTLEPAGNGFALRLGLRQVEGLGREAAERLTRARQEPFQTLADLVLRTRLNGRTIRALAAADAFRSMGLDRRAALWEARALRNAPDLPLFRPGEDEGAEPLADLPQMPLCEQVVADYQTLRLSLKAHPLAFLRASMARQGFTPAAEVAGMAQGARLRLAGLVLVRQRPGSANGVCFVTLEDETGVANLVIWPKVMAAFRKVVMTARLMQVNGRVQRDPRSGVVHVVAETLEDRSDVLLRLSDRSLAPPLSRADEVKRPIPAPSRGHPRNARIIPGSRDFH